MIDSTLGRTQATISKHSRRGVGLLLMMIPMGAVADAGSSGPYVSASVVRSSMDVDSVSQRARIPYAGDREQFDDQQSTGWSVAAGYRFLRYFSVEAGFMDFGTKTLSPPEPLVTHFSHTSRTNALDTDIEMKGAYWAVGGSYPIKDWEPYAKVGSLRAETRVTTHKVTCFCGVSVLVPSTTEFDVTQSDASTEILLTIGLRYVIADDYVIALEAMHVSKAGSAKVTGDGDLKSLSLAFQYRF